MIIAGIIAVLVAVIVASSLIGKYVPDYLTTKTVNVSSATMFLGRAILR